MRFGILEPTEMALQTPSRARVRQGGGETTLVRILVDEGNVETRIVHGLFTSGGEDVTRATIGETTETQAAVRSMEIAVIGKTVAQDFTEATGDGTRCGAEVMEGEGIGAPLGFETNFGTTRMETTMVGFVREEVTTLLEFTVTGGEGELGTLKDFGTGSRQQGVVFTTVGALRMPGRVIMRDAPGLLTMETGGTTAMRTLTEEALEAVGVTSRDTS